MHYYMADPFTINIFVPEGDPDGLRIIDRLRSSNKFIVFPRTKWEEIKARPEFRGAGLYILTGYDEKYDDDLPTIYIGQADNIRNRIEQHIKGKDFWEKAVVFTSSNDRFNATHAKWLEYSLVKRVFETNRSHVDNGNSPAEPSISESEKAEMKILLAEIYQTLPLVDLRAFEKPRAVEMKVSVNSSNGKDTIVVPAQEDGFNRVFLGENSWYAIRISGGMLDKIKYIAGYQVSPIANITHYAKVKNIELYGEEGKYRVNFDGKATELKDKLANDFPKGYGTIQAPRYTSFSKLMKARKLSDLF